MSTHITIKNIPPRIRYVSDGTNVEYEFPFAVFQNTDLKVYLDNTCQNETTYTVIGGNDGGKVTFNTPPASGTIITLTRELSIERTTDFQEGVAIRPNTLNHELDYQIACQQQIADNLNRSMVLPPYAVDIGVNLTLPTPAAGKAIVWNAEGTNLENSTVDVNALESTLKSYRDAAQSAATDAAAKVTEAATQVNLATAQAQSAAAQATTATQQAALATDKAAEAAAKATEAATVLNTKLNTDGTNLTDAGKSALITLSMPDYDNPIAIALPDSGQLYTVPYSGILTVVMECMGNGTWIYFRKNSSAEKLIDALRQYGTYGGYDAVRFPVKAGDVLWHERSGPLFQQIIFPFKGGSNA